MWNTDGMQCNENVNRYGMQMGMQCGWELNADGNGDEIHIIGMQCAWNGMQMGT